MKLTSNSNEHSTSETTSTDYVYLALIPFFAVPLVLLIGSFLNTYYCWGFSTWNVVNSELAVSALAAGLLAILLLLAPPISNVLQLAIDQSSVSLSRIPRFVSVPLISVLLFSLFYILRSEALVYGDGYLMMGILSAPISVELSGQLYLQILSTLFNRSLIELLTSHVGIGAENAFAIINIIGGIAGFWALVSITRKLADSASTRVFLFFAAISSGATLLFFGHIENYTWPISLSLWSLHYLIKYIRGESRWFPMVALGILAFLFHAIAGPMLMVSLLAVYSVKTRNTDNIFGCSHRNCMYVVVGVLLLGIVLWQLAIETSALGLPSVFVTLWPVADNSYWFLSADHIIDMLNLMFFLTPLGVLLLPNQIILGDKNDSSDAVGWILAWLALLTFLEVFWTDPGLGAPRDWDLFAIAGFPLSLWTAHKFASTSIFNSHRTLFAGAAVVVAVLHLAPHVYEKNNSEIAVERLDAILWECPHYQTTYREASRGLSWGTTIGSSLRRADLAEKYFHRILSVTESSSSAWFNLGQIYHFRGAIDSAAVYLTESVKLDPNNSLYLLKLADTKHKQNKNLDALMLISRSEYWDPENPTIHTTKAIILYSMGRAEEALVHFLRAYELEPHGVEQNYNLGVVYYALSDYDKAYSFLNRAISADSTAVHVFEMLITVQLELGKEDEASAALQRYRLINSEAKSLDYYRTNSER